MIDKYYKDLKKKFEDLIKSETTSDTYDEAKIHEFLEQNPTCLIGVVMNPKVDGFNMYGDAIFSKISIGNWERRVPDFTILTFNSVEITLNFIEIEAPNRKIFTAQNDFTADFNHSFLQLEDWKRLFPGNEKDLVQKMIVSCFSDIGVYDGSQAINAKYILVYGSSQEYTGNQQRIHRLAQRNNHRDFYFTSYDRLVRNFYHNRGLFTLKYNSLSGGFKAIGWAPFLNYPLDRRREYGRIEDKKSIVENSILTDEQKNKLILQMETVDAKKIRELESKDLGIDLLDFDVFE